MMMVVAGVMIMPAMARETNPQHLLGQVDNLSVPEPVLKAFRKQFPGVNPKWEKEGNSFEANFKYTNTEMSVVYLPDGSLVETELEIFKDELPASVIAYVKRHYKNAEIKEAAKITKAGGEVNYEAEVKGKDLLFDASGNFIKEVND